MSAERERHIGFFLRHLRLLPQPYEGGDQQRMSLLYFCISALDLMGALDAVDAGPIVEWVYAQQLRGAGDDATGTGVEAYAPMATPSS